MPTLELLIDASGMQRGAQQAESALRTVTTAAERTARAVDSVYGGGSVIGGSSGASRPGGGLGSVFQATGGSVQIAQGIAQTATAFGQLNAQAALFSSARTLLEVGNTVRDFQQFRTAVGGAATVFGTLGAVIRANPIGAAATAIGLAATAMSLFGNNTKTATDRIKDQGQALDRLREGLPELGQRVALGQEDPRGTDRGLIDAIIALRSGNGATLRAGEAANIFGVSESFLRGGLQDFDINQRALERDAPGVVRDEAGNIVANPGRLIQAYANQGPGGFTQRTFTADELARFGTQLLQERRGIRDASQINDTGDLEAAGFRAAELEAEFASRNRDEEAARQASGERISESLERAARFAEDIGASVGDAAAQILFAGQSLRGAVSGILRQFATQGLQSVGAGVFGALTRVVGSTATQQQGNQPVPGETPRI